MPTRIAERGRVLVLAPGAPAALEGLVRSLLESDEVLDRLAPIGRPGVNSRIGAVVLGERRYALKRYAWPLVDAVRTLGHGTRARAEFEALAVLEGLVPIPVRPLAWGEKRSLGFASRSVLVTEVLEGAVDLKTWRLGFVHGERAASERAALLEALPALARLLRRLHDEGFHAGTALHKNVLWRPAAPPQEAFSFLDLPFASRFSGPLPERSRLADLACLDKDSRMVLSSSERLRFFLAYRGRLRLEPGDRAALQTIASLRARREHSTFFWGLERRVKRFVKRTVLGRFFTGRDPDAALPRRLLGRIDSA